MRRILIPDLPKSLGYYFITDSSFTILSAVEQVKKVVESRAEVRLIQYREKNKPVEEIEKELVAIRKIVDNKALLIVNDHLELALKYGDGVHLGEKDTPLETAISEANKLNRPFIIGASATSIKKVEELNNIDVDYIGFGPVFQTKTKADAEKPLGIENLKKALKLSKHRIVAIGGITTKNLEKVIRLKPWGICAISSVVKEREIDLETVLMIQKQYCLI